MGPVSGRRNAWVSGESGKMTENFTESSTYCAYCAYCAYSTDSDLVSESLVVESVVQCWPAHVRH